MLSDLVNIDEMLEEISFEGKLGTPLKPFEQLMACMPPSQAHTLPEPYRWLMTSSDSPIIDFYPRAFTVDMNGKRWPWEAVVLLPFIDSQRLLEYTKDIGDDSLSPEEQSRNQAGHALVMKKESAALKIEKYESTDWKCDDGVFEPILKAGTAVPLPGLPSLRSAPIRSMWRRRLGVNVFGMPSRYKTACLEHSVVMPRLPGLETLGQALIGSTIWINYPHLTEGFITSVSTDAHVIRGKETALQRWSIKEAETWISRRDQVVADYETGQGFTGTGGLTVSPNQDIILTVRPFESLRQMPDGTTVKTFSKSEIDVPIVATLWSPPQADPRIAGLPSLLEKDPYKFLQPEKESKKKVTDKGKQKDRGRKTKDGKKNPRGVASSQRSKKDMEADPPAPTPSSPMHPNGTMRLPSSTPILPDSSDDSVMPVEQPKAVAESKQLSLLDVKSSDSRRKPAKRGGKKANSVLPAVDAAPTSLNGSSKRRSPGRGKWSGESLAAPPPDNFEVLPPMASYEVLPPIQSYDDVWRPIDEKFVRSDGLHAPQSPRPTDTSEAVLLAANGTNASQMTLPNETTEAKGVNVEVCKASNRKWWEQIPDGAQKSVSRQFSSLRFGSQCSSIPFRSKTASGWHNAGLLKPHMGFTPATATTRASRPAVLSSGGRGRLVAVGLTAAAFFFGAGANLATCDAIQPVRRGMNTQVATSSPGALSLLLRGGGAFSFEGGDSNDNINDVDNGPVPPLKFEHGTTTLSFVFQGGAIVAVDSRASIGNFVGSKTVQKVLPINS